KGNNNAYCQDNAISWTHWILTPAKRDLLDFTRYMIALRKQYAVLHRRKFFQGRSIRGSGIEDIKWFEPTGAEMSDAAWAAQFVRSLGVRLDGRDGTLSEKAPERSEATTLFIMFNAHHERLQFQLPEEARQQWERLLDTAQKDWDAPQIVRTRV